MTTLLIIAIIALYILYKLCVIDFVDREQERTWRDDIEEHRQQLGCPFDEPLNDKP